MGSCHSVFTRYGIEPTISCFPLLLNFFAKHLICLFSIFSSFLPISYPPGVGVHVQDVRLRGVDAPGQDDLPAAPDGPAAGPGVGDGGPEQLGPLHRLLAEDEHLHTAEGGDQVVLHIHHAGPVAGVVEGRTGGGGARAVDLGAGQLPADTECGEIGRAN